MIFAACALGAAIGFVTATPVSAEGATENSSLITLIDKAGKTTEKVINPVLEDLPAPDGWHERSVCVGYEGVDRALCVYFPYPL